MLLFICLEERIRGGWNGCVKEAWYFLGRIGGGYYFTETYIRWYDIACFPDTDIRCSDIEDCVSCLEIPEILKN